MANIVRNEPMAILKRGKQGVADARKLFEDYLLCCGIRCSRRVMLPPVVPGRLHSSDPVDFNLLVP